MVKLGQEVRDKITGFTGIAVGEVEYLYGCNQFGVSSKMNENGEIKDSEFFDEGRLEFIGDGVIVRNGDIPQWSNEVKLGEEAIDTITGFKGIVIGRARFLFGSVRYGISPKVNEKGEIKGSEFFNAGQVKAVDKGIKPEEVQGKKKGGVSRDVPRNIR